MACIETVYQQQLTIFNLFQIGHNRMGFAYCAWTFTRFSAPAPAEQSVENLYAVRRISSVPVSYSLNIGRHLLNDNCAKVPKANANNTIADVGVHESERERDREQ